MEQELRVPVSDARGPFVKTEGLSLKTPVGPVYEGVSLEVERGKVCCIYGEQGSGKTSLMLTLCGRMKPSRGRATVAGHDLHKKYRLIRRMSGLSFIPGLNDVQSFLEVKRITAAELALAGKRGNKTNTDKYLKDWGFFDKKEVKFKDLDSYDTCLFGILLAMCGDPELLVVDDVQTNVTQHQSIKIMGYLKEIAAKRGTTVLVGCSEYEIARQADCVVVMGEEAESQRRAVIRELAVPLSQMCPVVGSGNGVEVETAYSDGSAGPSAGPSAEADAGPKAPATVAAGANTETEAR